MENISKDQEKQILDGLKSAIKQANTGVSPSKAIAKAASDLGFGKDFTLRMVEAFNVSKTLKHYKEASGEDRAGTFAIADPVEVLSEMYPQTVATPAQKQAATYIPEQVLAKEATFFELHKPTIPLHSETEVHTYGQTDINFLMRKAYGYGDQLQKVADADKLEMAVARNKMVAAIDKFAAYFREFGHIPFAEVEAHLVEKNSAAKHICNMAYEISNGIHLGEKRASAVKLSASTKIAAVETLYAGIEAATAAYIKSAKVASISAAEVKTFKEELRKRARFLSKASSALDTAKDIGMLAELKSKPNKGALQQAAVGNVLDPALDAEYSNINSQLMLSDLMKNDPVLKRHDPSKVLNAYNEVAGITPRLAESPLMMRTVLRRYLEGDGVDTFEAKNLLDVENQMKKRDEPGVDYKYLLGGAGAGGGKDE